MTKHVVLMLVAIGLGFVVAEEAEDSAVAVVKTVRHALYAEQPMANGGGVTKQRLTCTEEQAGDILKDYPTYCTAALQSLDSQAIMKKDPIATEWFGHVFCRPNCGNPIIEFYETCITNGQSFSFYFRQLCSWNDRGDSCSSAVVISSISNASAACPTLTSCGSNCTCRSALQSTTTRVGCCINILDGGGLTDVTDYIESSCNVDVPEPCKRNLLDDGHMHGSGVLAVAPTMEVLIGALAMLVTDMLQWLL